jgi:predicted DCC family thiol-disulfide oxidoreductase YuxK
LTIPQAVKNWRPRWKPYLPGNSQIFFARHCHVCQEVEQWIRSLQPQQLQFHDAATHPRHPLTRVTYRHADGHEEQGIVAIARCLEHVNLLYAFFAWSMRLPGISHFFQIILDAVADTPHNNCPTNHTK